MTLPRAIAFRVPALLCLAPVAVLLHEHAHAAAAQCFGWRARVVVPDRFALDDWGARFEYDADDATWPEHAVVALAGPAASFAWFSVLVALSVVLPRYSLALTPAALFAARALIGCGSDLAAARHAIGCALADALGEEVDATTSGVALAALRLARRRLA